MYKNVYTCLLSTNFFNFLLNLIFERKKVADKTTTDLKGQKIRTNQNTLKSVSTPHGLLIRI